MSPRRPTLPRVLLLFLAVAVLPSAPGCKPQSREVTVQVLQPSAYAEVLSSHKGKVILVDFWATWCAPCRKQFPHTVELANKHAPGELAVISMSLDSPDEKEEALTFLRTRGAWFENYLSADGASEEAYAAFDVPPGLVPYYKLYDRTGKLRHRFFFDPVTEKGFTPEDIDKAVEELLAQE